jgi:tetratricopeptide (TPR) repeat protein
LSNGSWEVRIHPLRKEDDAEISRVPPQHKIFTSKASRMRVPDWRNLGLGDGILAEPVREDNRIVLWRPTDQDRDYQYWERIGTSPRSDVQVDGGICTTPATSVLARQRRNSGLLGKLARKLTGAGADETWTLPNGQPAEKCGDRKSDIVLAWPEDKATPLDEPSARSRWPRLTRFEKLGDRLFLVAGVGSTSPGAQSVQPPGGVTGVQGTEELGCPIALAEQILEAARKSGNRSQEAAALTDLGIVTMNEGDLNRAVVHLDKAVGLARELGDRAREVDALNNLAYALLALGQAHGARQVLEQTLLMTRQVGDPYAEKLVVERLGMAHANLGDPAGALSLADQALAMTRALSDRQQETRILWNQAIALADLNRRDQAIAKAQESIDLLRKLGKPEASWYGAQLQRYRMDFAGLSSSAPGGPMGASVTTAAQTGIDPNSGPGLLRMAVSATKAMMRFIGSGLKATPAPIQQNRMATCLACQHHTGLRCRVCGCFTNVKTRMAHEQCPIGKWPA